MRSYLARVRLVTKGDAVVTTDLLARELPNMRVEVTDACGVCDPIVDAEAWTAATDLAELDAAVTSSPSDAVSVRGEAEHLALVACQVIGRYHRFVDRRNGFSDTRAFDAVLRGHCGVFDSDDAGWQRSRDRWQWLLRVAPNATLAAQVAALFRDVPDRLEPVGRAAGLAEAVRVRALRMARDGDPDVEDAEGLSFLSLESARSNRREVTSVAASLCPPALAKLALVHVTPEVRHWLFESVAA
jgi:hypothetical protein